MTPDIPRPRRELLRSTDDRLVSMSPREARDLINNPDTDGVLALALDRAANDPHDEGRYVILYIEKEKKSD